MKRRKGEQSYLLVANPYEIANNDLANVRLLEYRSKGRDGAHFRTISFPDGKPSDTVLEFLKSQGIQWNRPAGRKSWSVTINYPTRNQDRLHAERVFQSVINMILEEKGLAPEPELQQQF